MKTIHILGISSVVLAIGLGTLATRNHEKPGNSAAEVAATGAKLSSRDGSGHSTHENEPSGPPRVGRRDTPDPKAKGDAEKQLNTLLTEAEKIKLAEARLAFRELPDPPAPRSGRDRAYAKLSEDLRTAISTNPDGWIETYDSLRRDFEARHGARSGGGGRAVPSDPDSGSSPNPETPEVTPETPGDNLPPIDLDWAEEQAKRLREFERRSKPTDSERDPRFKRPTQ